MVLLIILSSTNGLRSRDGVKRKEHESLNYFPIYFELMISELYMRRCHWAVKLKLCMVMGDPRMTDARS